MVISIICKPYTVILYQQLDYGVIGNHKAIIITLEPLVKPHVKSHNLLAQINIANLFQYINSNF